jgi:hypothetical protein
MCVDKRQGPTDSLGTMIPLTDDCQSRDRKQEKTTKNVRKMIREEEYKRSRQQE